MAKKLPGKMERVRVVEFVVEGSGEFPFDMLRYDQAVPLREIEIDGVYSSGRQDKRRIQLRSYAGGPTTVRWRSFGWNVVEVKQ